MTEKEIQELAERLVTAIEHLAPGGPSFWTILSALGPLVTLLAAYLVYRSAKKTLKQKQEADDRAEWWRRTQWALESAASKDEKLNAAGTAMIPLMNTSKLISDEDKDLLDTIWKVDPASSDEESAEEFEQRLDAFEAFDESLLLDDSLETGENGSTEEVEDAESNPQ